MPNQTPLLIKAFSDFLFKNIGSTILHLNRFDPYIWFQKTVLNKNKIKSFQN